MPDRILAAPLASLVNSRDKPRVEPAQGSLKTMRTPTLPFHPTPGWKVSPIEILRLGSSQDYSGLVSRFIWLSFLASTFFFVAVGASQVIYPGFTEPMEGDVLQHIERASLGLPVYPKPGVEYIALAFMPLYYYLSVPFYLMFGDSFLGPRLLSALLAFGSGALILRMAWRETGRVWVGMLAASFFFASYRIADASLFSALPDSLMLFLLLAGLYYLRFGTTKVTDILWLLCFCLAFWTKQQGSTYFLLAVAYAWVSRTSHLPRWVLVAALLLGGPVLYYLLGPQFGDHFFYHTFVVPQRWPNSIWASLERMGYIILACTATAWVLSWFSKREAWSSIHRRISAFHWFTVAAFLSTLFSMAKVGSSNNHYVPLIAGLSLTGALGFSEILDRRTPIRVGLALALLTILSVTLTVTKYLAGEGPFYMNVGWLALAMTAALYWLLQRRSLTPIPHNQLAAVLLALGQLASASYIPLRYMPPLDYPVGVTRLREVLASLEEPLLILPYGNVPQSLTSRPTVRAPSWVALGDELRQNPSRETFIALKSRIVQIARLHVLTETPLKEVPVYGVLADLFEPVKDYGAEFRGVGQNAIHWYSGRSKLRYLYRLKPTATPVSG